MLCNSTLVLHCAKQEEKTGNFNGKYYIHFLISLNYYLLLARKNIFFCYFCQTEFKTYYSTTDGNPQNKHITKQIGEKYSTDANSLFWPTSYLISIMQAWRSS